MQMKALLGKSYEELTAELSVTVMPEKRYWCPEIAEGFSIYVDDNEYLFSDGSLSSIKISNFSAAQEILGFVFPIVPRLGQFLAALGKKGIAWGVYSMWSRDNWVVIKLQEHDIAYEYKFTADRFELQCIRLARFDISAMYRCAPHAHSEVLSKMPRLECKCGNIINLSSIPCLNEYFLIPAGALTDVFSALSKERPRIAERRLKESVSSVIVCESCGRQHHSHGRDSISYFSLVPEADEGVDP